MRQITKMKLFVAAICAGRARWERFPSGNAGEICTLGLRHYTDLDFRGLPIITDHAAEALQETMRHEAVQR